MIRDSVEDTNATRETPDIASSTEDYARRFAGAIGAYMLEVQNRLAIELASPWPAGRMLDVGGGHAQLAGPLVDAGYAVTILGSDASCVARPRRLYGDRVTCVIGDLLDLPFDDRSFDLVLAFRMLAHIDNWQAFVAGLCRVARAAVIIDYPAMASINALTPLLFELKRRIEGNTRTYRLFRRGDVEAAFGAAGFTETATAPQFFWPMALHRALGSPALSRRLEAVARTLGATSAFGSPVIVRATRGAGAPPGQAAPRRRQPPEGAA
jgi:SAM-dependent methyltransferase